MINISTVGIKIGQKTGQGAWRKKNKNAPKKGQKIKVEPVRNADDLARTVTTIQKDIAAALPAR